MLLIELTFHPCYNTGGNLRAGCSQHLALYCSGLTSFRLLCCRRAWNDAAEQWGRKTIKRRCDMLRLRFGQLFDYEPEPDKLERFEGKRQGQAQGMIVAMKARIEQTTGDYHVKLPGKRDSFARLLETFKSLRFNGGY